MAGIDWRKIRQLPISCNVVVILFSQERFLEQMHEQMCLRTILRCHGGCFVLYCKRLFAHIFDLKSCYLL